MANYPLPSVFLSIYLVLSLIILVQLAVVVISSGANRRQRLRSYKTMFNSLCLVWTSLRFVFWLLLRVNSDGDIDPITIEYLLFWLPHALEFATFGLLGLYFYKAMYRAVWVSRRSVAYGIFCSVTGAVFVLVAVEAVSRGIADEHSSDPSETSLQKRWDAAEAITVGVVFFALSLFFAFIAWKARGMSQSLWSRSLIDQSQRVVYTVTFTLFAVFASRSVFNFVAAAGKVTVLINTSDVTNNIESFIVYAIWEIFPVCLLLATVASGGSSHSGYTASKRRGFGLGAVDTDVIARDAQSSATSFNDGYFYKGSSPDTSGPTGLVTRPATLGGRVREGSGALDVTVTVADDAVDGDGEVGQPSYFVDRPPSRQRRYKWKRGSRKVSRSHQELSDVSDMAPVSRRGSIQAPDGENDGYGDGYSDGEGNTAQLQQPLLRAGNASPHQPPEAPLPYHHQQQHQQQLNKTTKSASTASLRSVGHRGLAAGAKARIVSLSGEDNPYSDSIPGYYSEYGQQGGGGTSSYGYSYMDGVGLGSYTGSPRLHTATTMSSAFGRQGNTARKSTAPPSTRHSFPQSSAITRYDTPPPADDDALCDDSE